MGRHFIGIVHTGKDGGFGVYFPQVPGCHSAADTMEELAENSKEALELALEYVEPVKMSFAEALGDENARDATAFILVEDPRGKAAKLGKLVKALLSIDSSVLARIDEAAKERGLTRSAFMAQAALDRATARTNGSEKKRNKAA